MKGVQVVVAGTGKKKAVLIDLAEWDELWEDISDVMVSHMRKDEPTVPWDELKKDMSSYTGFESGTTALSTALMTTPRCSGSRGCGIGAMPIGRKRSPWRSVGASCP